MCVEGMDGIGGTQWTIMEDWVGWHAYLKPYKEACAIFSRQGTGF